MGDILIKETNVDKTRVTVRMRGEVDADTASDMRGVLVDMILRRKPAQIVLDLQDVTAIDSTALGALSAAYEAAADLGQPLAYHTAGSAVCDQLRLAGIPLCDCHHQDRPLAA